jgi:putative flippase GtrA
MDRNVVKPALLCLLNSAPSGSMMSMLRQSRFSLKLISFALVGVGNTAIDFGVFMLCYNLVELPLIVSNVMAWLVAVSCSYIVNTLTTFSAESGRVLRWRDYISFVLSGVLGVLATTAVLVVMSNFVQIVFAKLLSILAGFLVNFTMSHFIVFRSRNPAG